jgi:hypothetical protein
MTAGRAEAQPQAAAAAKSGSPYAEAAFAGVAALMASAVDRGGACRSRGDDSRGEPVGRRASAGVAPLMASTVDRQVVRA